MHCGSWWSSAIKFSSCSLISINNYISNGRSTVCCHTIPNSSHTMAWKSKWMEKIRLQCWPPKGQQVSHHRCIWGINCSVLDVDTCAFITIRKRSWYLCFYMCLSVHGEGGVSQHALQVVSQHALQLSRGGCRSSGPHPGGNLRDLAGGSPDPHRGCIPACTEADHPPVMATTAGGTHPTWIHSCSVI